jgi:hypothetical protein
VRTTATFQVGNTRCLRSRRVGIGRVCRVGSGTPPAAGLCRPANVKYRVIAIRAGLRLCLYAHAGWINHQNGMHAETKKCDITAQLYECLVQAALFSLKKETEEILTIKLGILTK